MNRKSFLAAGAGMALAAATATRAKAAPASSNYLGHVETFADTLLEKGRDTFGPRKTALWAAVIDTRTLSVPRAAADVPSPPGTRPGDRAVGGSNLLHDVVTQRAFRVLSAVTGDKKYSAAANDYLHDTLRCAQNPLTGLLAWGEHTYYDLFADEGSVHDKYREQQFGGLWHELLAWTPPWAELWAVDSARTARAIAGLRFHFHDPEGNSLFNRHAYWDRAQYQLPAASQPWIKHSGLYAHAFFFLHARTGEAEWLRRGRNIAALYWAHRNPKTDLTLGCIGDPRPNAQQASLGGTASLAYWLYKAYQACPSEKSLRTRALTLLKAYDRRGYDKTRDGYRAAVTLDGAPVEKSDALSPTWASAYGEGSLPKFGRMAAYLAAAEKDTDCLEMARRVARLMRRDPLPQTYVAEPIGYALGLSLDLFDLTGETAYLSDARRYADLALAKLWRNGLFTRQTDDPFYEAKLGTGDLVAGLLRLHLRLKPGLKEPPSVDWSV